MPDPAQLTRRERQIMDVVYRLGTASAAEVQEGLPDPPSYSAVRAMLTKLEKKGHLEHGEENLRYVYRPVVPRAEARESAVSRLVRIFFGGSVADAVTGILGRSASELSDDELAEIESLVRDARRRKETSR